MRKLSIFIIVLLIISGCNNTKKEFDKEIAIHKLLVELGYNLMSIEQTSGASDTLQKQIVENNIKLEQCAKRIDSLSKIIDSVK